MVIHVVKPGDTLYSLSLEYGVAMSLIAIDNGLEAPQQLVPGQALVIRFPLVVHTVRPGETLAAIAREYGVSLRQLYQNNLALEGRPDIWPGQTLVISYQQESGPEIGVNAYAYSNISADLLSTTLPFLTFLTPFTYLQRAGPSPSSQHSAAGYPDGQYSCQSPGKGVPGPGCGF